MSKRYFTFFLAILLIVLFIPLPSSAEEPKPIRVLVDYDFVDLETAPFIEDGTTLVEFRPIFERLGLTVSWNKDTKTILGETEDLKIQLKIGDKNAIVNGQNKEMIIAPKIINGHTLVPLRFIAENSGTEVEWDSKLRFIQIFSLNGQLRNAVIRSCLAYGYGDIDEYQKEIEIIQEKLNKGADPNYVSYLGSSLLDSVASIGSSQVAEILLAAGADVNLKSDGITPLMQASDYIRWDIVEVLLKYNPDLSITDDDGLTILERILNSDYSKMNDEYRVKFQFTMVLFESYIKKENLGKPYESLVEQIKDKNPI